MRPRAAAVFEQGRQLLRERRVDDALAALHAAERLGFDPVQCAAARWDCWMLRGDFLRAWAESDSIAAAGVADPHRFWDGQPWHERHILLRGLHGLGDTIQFIRYAALLRGTAASVILQVHPRLVTLMEGVEGVDHVITWPDSNAVGLRPWDMQMEVTELPRAFRSALWAVPSAVPYIAVPEERQEWARRLAGARREPRVGLVWKAGEWNPPRSMELDELAPLWRVRGVSFYSFQMDADLSGAPGSLLALDQHSADVRDTAALLLQMDLLITVDTMAAHLAGALGMPVWILLPFEADWRWMLERDDSPWYPTARLFRQTRAGDWRAVLEQVERELRLTVRAADRGDGDANGLVLFLPNEKAP